MMVTNRKFMILKKASCEGGLKEVIHLVLLQILKRDEVKSNSGTRRLKVSKCFILVFHSAKWMRLRRVDLMYLWVVDFRSFGIAKR